MGGDSRAMRHLLVSPVVFEGKSHVKLENVKTSSKKAITDY
jgi:hypothetical protein